jgi:hypothetical protein
LYYKYCSSKQTRVPFVSGYGGIGKTFLWNTIIAYLRAHKKIVASLLLSGGHSLFRIPCDDLDETTTCNIKCETMLCELIQATSLIIWDEALMTHKIAFESLDRTLLRHTFFDTPSFIVVATVFYSTSTMYRGLMFNLELKSFL